MKNNLTKLFSSKKAAVKKAYNTALAAAITSTPGMAFAGGGLQAATTQANDIQRWIYTFLGVVCLGYLSWKVLSCLFEWDQWNNMPKIGRAHV